FQSRKSWIEETFFKRECVKFISSSRDHHRCIPVCQVCQNLIRCCCGRLMSEHSWQYSAPPISFHPGPGQDLDEDWSVERHTIASPTNAYGTVDFEDTATRVCRAKYVRLAVDSKPEVILQLMLREWQMERPKLLLTVQGGSDNFILPPKVNQAFSKGLMTAALSTGAWILTDGINTGVSKYVGEAMKKFGGHDLRKRSTVGITPWGVTDNNTDLIGRDVFRPYQPLGNPLSKRDGLNRFHSHFLLVDDGTMGKHGCQHGLRTKLEKHIQLQRIHPRLNQGVPVVCVVVEGGPTIVSTVLDYVSSVPPVPVFVFEGSGRAADLLAFLHKQTANNSPAEQLSMALAWDRADIAQKNVLVYGQHWQVGSLEQAMLDALVMDRVSFVKLLIDNGMTMSRFLTVERLEELYNTPRGQMKRFFHHLVEDVKQTSLPIGYRLSLIDMGLVIEYLIGGAYRSSYTRKHFRNGRRDSSSFVSKQRRGLIPVTKRSRSSQDLHFFRTAQPYKRKERDTSPGSSQEITSTPGLGDSPILVPFNFNDLFVWAVLQQRQQMALFLWQHGEEALARATVACKLYRSMALEARQSSMDDDISERFKTYSLEFGQLAVDVLDCAFRQNEQMSMKLLTSEMEAWSHFTCLQMAVSSGHRPFVSHSCTQTLLTDLWTGPLNMRKNSFLKIILSLLLPPAILLLEFKSKAEMCHVPQSHEAIVTFSSLHSQGTEDAERGLSFHDRCFVPVSQTVSSITQQCLSWITMIYEFYTAPVVKFWFHTMSYLAFLMLFSYTVLVKMGDQPSAQEWLVIAYILSTAVEKTREVLMSEPRKISQKLKIWFSEYWNINDFIAIILFLVGLVMRLVPGPFQTAGRLSYCLDIIFWFVRVLDLLAVNQHAGPYLTMITKMTRNMFFIVVMMAIVLLSFGVSRKAILSPNEEPSWNLARDIVFQPYWMIYGEVYASEIDPCANGQPCPPASFLTPFLQAVYMFFQYIIMVNILIAFFNNIYFDMASTSNKLWRYNRYRYIMTYQERPWLPPPLILLSHMTLALRAIYNRLSGDTEREERGSGLKLYLGHEDRKKLHEFEEKCLEAYFHERNEGPSNQINRIRVIAERLEEMSMMVGEVSEKVHFIQDSLSGLDCQLGQLQDLSALAVDTITLLSASDSLQQEEARLAQCRPIAASRHIVPHSWTLPYRSGADFEGVSMRRNVAKSCKSTPPSLLKGYNLMANRLTSQECHGGSRGSRGGRQGHTEEGGAKEEAQSGHVHNDMFQPASHTAFFHHYGGADNQTPSESCGPSRCGSPLSPRVSDRGLESLHYKLWTCEPHMYPTQEEAWMDEEEEELYEAEAEDQKTKEQLSTLQKSRTSSKAILLSDPRDISEGLVNPAFCPDDNQVRSRSRPSSQWRASVKTPRWACQFRDRPYGYCRSLSSSVENITFPGAAHNPLRGSFPTLNEPMRKESMERNNLMRLAHTIPFTLVSIMGKYFFMVSLYISVSSWSSRGLSAMLQPLASEEGSLDGGLRQGCRVLCTWAEQDVLKPGLVYVVKAFRTEVVRAWQRYFEGSTALQLCLRDIQQQRAAQKMMNVFNQIKPEDMHHSPRFLDVSLVLWHSNGQWLTIERNMSGDFRKYNNNTGEEIAPCCTLEEMLLAFSHWTYEYSCRELLVLDIQGVGEELTDPTVIMAEDRSRVEMLFGPDNLGDTAINGFLQKHSCNTCCRRLGLAGQKYSVLFLFKTKRTKILKNIVFFCTCDANSSVCDLLLVC
uniref:non-specific serine/threonine protein kinase n=1 Tax=Sphaeramia orbicularis TaxID=375764 RepID=A0A673CCD2_9TELE